MTATISQIELYTMSALMNRSLGWSTCCLTLVMWIACLSRPAVVCAEPQAPADNTVPVAAQPLPATETAKPSKPPLSAAERARRRSTAQQAILYTIGLMVVLVGGLFGFMVWMSRWSRKTHALLQKPLPPAPRGDELWYLKKAPRQSAQQHPDVPPQT